MKRVCKTLQQFSKKEKEIEAKIAEIQQSIKAQEELAVSMTDSDSTIITLKENAEQLAKEAREAKKNAEKKQEDTYQRFLHDRTHYDTLVNEQETLKEELELHRLKNKLSVIQEQLSYLESRTEKELEQFSGDSLDTLQMTVNGLKAELEQFDENNEKIPTVTYDHSDHSDRICKSCDEYITTEQLQKFASYRSSEEIRNHFASGGNSVVVLTGEHFGEYSRKHLGVRY